ncbi:hypothetical protein JCM33374_g656 [Metschnikowia sp. JCM 33374]|nr:hypothetical protein JCM33374_g656 [Metschnikowia sp. JCM 33374]
MTINHQHSLYNQQRASVSCPGATKIASYPTQNHVAAPNIQTRDEDAHKISLEADYRLDLLFVNLKRWIDIGRDSFNHKGFAGAEKELLSQLNDVNELVYKVGKSDMPKLPTKGMFLMNSFTVLRDNSAIISSMRGFDAANALRHELYELRPLMLHFFDSTGIPSSNIDGCSKWVQEKSKRLAELKSAFKNYGLAPDIEKVFNDECDLVSKELGFLRSNNRCQ